MNALVFTRTQKPGLDKKIGFNYVNSLEDLLNNSDIVSLHTPGTPETKGMVNKNFLKQMKEDAVLINTARGAVINDVELLAHLNENPNFWYGTDVYNGEPTAKEISWENLIA
jgi:phosphoglycerate dehydrogenase-like enzyme